MARTSSSLSAFLLALQAQVVGEGVTSNTQTQIVTEERSLEYIAGPNTVMIIPGACVPEDQGGEGQDETIFRGRIKFKMLCQTALDVATSDVIALTDDNTTTGIYVLFQNLLNAMRFFDNVDSSGNAYLTQPMRILDGPSQPRRSEKHAEYVICELTTEYKICLATGVPGS